jgi:endonuclease-3
MDRKRQMALRQLKLLSENPDEMRLAAEEWKNNFQILASTILSARTRDEVTIPVAERLFQRYPDAKSLSKAKLKDMQKMIKPVNFYRNKSRNVIKCAKAIVKDHGGKVPFNIGELIELPGVGRKTANVFLSEIGKDALAVDTHVAYISQKLGWTKHKNPEKIEEDLKKLFPKSRWSKVNSTLVRFGKTHTSRRKKDEALEEIRRVK